MTSSNRIVYKMMERNFYRCVQNVGSVRGQSLERPLTDPEFAHTGRTELEERSEAFVVKPPTSESAVRRQGLPGELIALFAADSVSPCPL